MYYVVECSGSIYNSVCIILRKHNMGGRATKILGNGEKFHSMWRVFWVHKMNRKIFITYVLLTCASKSGYSTEYISTVYLL